MELQIVGILNNLLEKNDANENPVSIILSSELQFDTNDKPLVKIETRIGNYEIHVIKI